MVLSAFSWLEKALAISAISIVCIAVSFAYG
jgi:hypothetical protein